MSPVSIFLLQFVLLFPIVASGQVVTDSLGQEPLIDTNFTHFTSSRDTGRLALWGEDGKYFNLNPFDKTPGSKYKLTSTKKQNSLKFVINNKALEPLEKRTYVGIEIIRMYTFSRVSDGVNLYRNPRWVNSEGVELDKSSDEGPSLPEFVKDHSPEQPEEEYLIKWHAHPWKNARSSWMRRDAILNGLGLDNNQKEYITDNKIKKAQGTYRLIGFYEASVPSPNCPVLFTVRLHGARYLLINVFGPKENGGVAYQNQYVLEIVS